RSSRRRVEGDIDRAFSTYCERLAFVRLRKLSADCDRREGDGNITSISHRDGIGRARRTDGLSAKVNVRGPLNRAGLRLQNDRRNRRLAEVEAIGRVVGLGISFRERRQSIAVFNELQK